MTRPDPCIQAALNELRKRLRERGLVSLYPGDYVTLMDDPESGDEGKQIAYIDVDGNLVESAP